MSILYPDISNGGPSNESSSPGGEANAEPANTGESYDGQWLLADSDTGQTMLTFTSFIEAAIKRSGSVVSEPIEKGSFASYNKTTDPLNAIVTLAITGTKANIQNTIDSLTDLQSNTVTFSLVSPVKEFENLTLENFSWKWERTQGADVLYVELALIEIREVEMLYTDTAVTSSATSTSISAADAKYAGDASPIDTGMTNTQEPSGEESNQAKKSMLNEGLGVIWS